MRIVIFTDRYPYGRSEEAFVANEVEYLATHRGEDTVVVVPLKGGGHCRAVPRGVEVAEPLIRGVRGWRGALALGCLPLRGAFWHFWGETLRCVARGSKLSRTWFSRYVAGELVANYAGVEMRRRAEGVLYSYWMSYGALGVALARSRHLRGGRWRCVSRAHGYDIRDGAKGIPLRGFTWRWIDAVFPVSYAGASALLAERGALRTKVRVSYLGVYGLARPCPISAEGERVLFVSCSSVRAVKRLDLMLRLIAAFARANGEVRVTWVHFGGGELLTSVRALALLEQGEHSNLLVDWRGEMTNAEVLRAYEKLGGAIFLNTSESEGLPVSIMEALSAGFPVVATNVGGTSEAVVEGAGELLGAEPGQDEFIDAVNRVRTDYATYARCARGVFEKRFDAERNYERFYGLIVDGDLRGGAGRRG